jgi:hypothetical protein
MKQFLCLLAAVAAVSLGIGVALASGPIAVFALVDKVTFEPNADKPERIQISGLFGITTGNNNNQYNAPQRGYLYFTLPKAQSDQALKEWADLKSVAGTRQVVGFGSAWRAAVRLRKLGEKADSPDEYLMGNGMVMVNASHPQAKALLEDEDR